MVTVMRSAATWDPRSSDRFDFSREGDVCVPRPVLSRRQLLASAGTGLAALAASPLLSGCTDDSPRPAPRSTSATPSANPDPAARAVAAADEQRLVASYEELLQRFPALSKPVQAVLDDHRAHLAALSSEASSAPAAATPTSSPPPTVSAAAASPTGATATTGTSGALPATPTAAVAHLVTLEQQAAESRLRQVPAVRSELARTLASIAASEATHAALLPAVATRDLASASASAAVSSAAQTSAGQDKR